MTLVTSRPRSTHVPQLVVAEDDADRVLRRVDLTGTVEVADDLDHGEELDAGTLGDVRQPEAIADAPLEAEGRDAAAVAHGHRGRRGGEDLDVQALRAREANHLDPRVEGGRPLGPVALGRDDRADHRGGPGPSRAPWARPG